MKNLLTILLLFSPLLLSGQNEFNLNVDRRSGMVNIPEINFGFGTDVKVDPNAGNFFGITNMTGYQFQRNTMAGIGYGIYKYDDGVLFPLFVETRLSLSGRFYVPYLSASGGAIISAEDFTGLTRLFVNPALGLRWVAMRNMALTFSTGVLLQSIGGDRSTFVNFKLGVQFKGATWNF